MDTPVNLVVGASGYVGSHLCRSLPDSLNVYGTYCTHPDAVAGKKIHLDLRDRGAVQRTIQSVKPEVIYLTVHDQNDLHGSIVAGTKNLLSALAERGSDCRLVFLSTDAVFDGETPPFDEESVPKPIYQYGIAKQGGFRS